jgi:hypothetical protein
MKGRKFLDVLSDCQLLKDDSPPWGSNIRLKSKLVEENSITAYLCYNVFLMQI